eukprot:scaffold10074_cov79-Cylindrotheca_fusiformis.AAC.1
MAMPQRNIKSDTAPINKLAESKCVRTEVQGEGYESDSWRRMPAQSYSIEEDSRVNSPNYSMVTRNNLEQRISDIRVYRRFRISIPTRPLQGEFYRLAKAPGTITIKVVQVHEGNTNKSAVRKYDQLASHLNETPLWDIPDEKIGFLVKRYTDPEATLPQEVDEDDYSSSSSEDNYEEPPKKKKAKRVLEARCSTGAPIRKTRNVDS